MNEVEKYLRSGVDEVKARRALGYQLEYWYFKNDSYWSKSDETCATNCQKTIVSGANPGRWEKNEPNPGKKDKIPEINPPVNPPVIPPVENASICTKDSETAPSRTKLQVSAQVNKIWKKIKREDIHDLKKIIII